MKKFLVGIAAAAIITVPMTSFALESLSKGALKKATGQAGVSIGLDNVVIYMSSQPTTTYWDNDGTSTGFSLETEHNSGATSEVGGTFSNIGTIDRAGLQIKYNNQAEKLITIGAILDGNKYGAKIMNETFGVSAGIADNTTTTVLDVTNGNAISSTGSEAGYVALNNQFVGGISPLTIDVGTCQALTQGLAYNKITNELSVYQGAKTLQTGAIALGGTSTQSTMTLTAIAADTSNAAAAATAAALIAKGIPGTTTGTQAAAVVVNPLNPIAVGANVYDTYTGTNTTNGKVADITRGLVGSKVNIVGVVIGLPTVEISTYHTKDSKTISVVVDNATSDMVANSGCQFIEIEKSGKSTMAILGGRLEIAPH